MGREPESDEQRARVPEAESDDGSFLSRWSRLKRAGEPPAHPAPAAAPGPAQPPEPATELTDEDMPDLRTIGEGSDISPFFSPKVSEGLRQAALKRLFRSPKFNLRDGLDDYDDDFRSFEALGDIVTSEMRRQRERAEARLRRELSDAQSPGDPQAGGMAEGEDDRVARTDADSEALDDDDRQDSDDPGRA